MKGKKIVVTGGAGFIGSNLARTLTKDNHVIVVDDLSTGHLENIQDLIDNQSITFVKGSVTDREFLLKTCKDVDYVFHQAAIVSVPHSIKDPIATNNVNINGTLNVLVAARDTHVQKVICASSCAIYGNTSHLPINECTSPDPQSPYAITKLVGDYYCQVFTRNYSLPTISLRYFNVYGPRQDPASEYAAVIPKFITNVLNDKLSIIYGDGKQTRDFIFIDDVVNANILAAEREVNGIFNIAGGKRISVNDLAKSIMEICKKNLDFIYKNPRLGDIKHSYADISKAKEKLHYGPKFNLTDGLKLTVEWFQKRREDNGDEQ